jgi:RimJ/RimL family protein N-acetyltransferase
MPRIVYPISTERLLLGPFTPDDVDDVFAYPVQLRSAGRVIGDVMLHWISREHGTGEIGYVFNPDYAGHGYATEAARALLHLGFADLGLRRIVARTDARNTASAAVLRRVGMRQEAHLVENEWFKGGWSDELDFAILTRGWASQRTDDAVTPRGRSAPR